MFNRASGFLVHPSSFPSSFGIGDFGEGAYEFIDFLYKSKQKLWQILPLGPLSESNSPYQCLSTFAGNELFISIEDLIERGFLTESDVKKYREESSETINFEKVKVNKGKLFKLAFENFNKTSNNEEIERFKEFCLENKEWLEDYALFIALREEYNYTIWTSWPDKIKSRNPEELKKISKKLKENIMLNKFIQYLFYTQWNKLRNYANSKNIKIIGDIPIFMPLDCADVWVNPELYWLNEEGIPTFVAGGPPDKFSATGQRWGNCLYNWENHKKEKYSWWIKRISSTLKLVDIIRIDHFRGFDEYWAIPYDEADPSKGSWKKGPGKELFNEVIETLGNIPIIVEDIGIITDSVTELRDYYNFPGIKILQCAFDGNINNVNLPCNFNTCNCVAYTGTHDTNTLLGWYNELNEEEKEQSLAYLNYPQDTCFGMICSVFSSVAVYSIIQIQDILNLGSEHRMNTPGTEHGNWKFRYLPGSLKDEYSIKLANITKLYNR